MKLITIALSLSLLVACKSKEPTKEAPAAGSAAKPAEPTPGSAAGSAVGSAAAGSAAAGSAAGSAAAGTAAGSAATATGCGPNAYTADDPPFCVELPAKYRKDLTAESSGEPTARNHYIRLADDNLIVVTGWTKWTDLKKGAKDARAILEGGADEDTKIKEEALPDGTAIRYKTCEAEQGCFDAITVVKKGTVGILTCEANARTPDPDLFAVCLSLRAK